MSWKDPEPAPLKVLTEEEKLLLLKKETHWTCSYNEPDRWIKDFKEVHHNLIGEYVIDEKYTLLRFELDEMYRDKFVQTTSHFHNVLIDKTVKPFKPAYTIGDK